ncbi:MAG TPA: putative sporulation protein YtxC [Syntrophomonadaceae bacterium]|nr:putative sporulation protein YtxC [Syntrophomonadaceae bacterium]
MLYEYQVATSQDSSYILDEINHRLRWLQEKGFSLNVDALVNDELSRTYNLKLLGENLDNVFREEDIIYIFKHQMSEVLAEHIIKDWEKKLLWKEVIRSSKGYTAKERNIIYEKANEFLKCCNNNESLDLLMKFGRKNRIAHKILDHINNSDIIVIEGFINFCMQDYLTEIRFAVDIAVEELNNEKEYNEFVKLLRFFVDSQVPKSYEVNLMMDNKGLFYIWDAEGLTIEETYMDYYLNDMLLDENNLDDILISILITIAPRRIILHNVLEYTDNEAVKTIFKVFHEKINICNGCERCYDLFLKDDKDRKN